MQRTYKFTEAQTAVLTESKLNIFKIKSKEKALKQFIKEYNILDVKTITFNEGLERDLLNMSVYYYVEITTSEL